MRGHAHNSMFLVFWLAAMCVVAVSSCADYMAQSDVTYYFTHPLLNEDWKPQNTGKAVFTDTASRQRVAAKDKASRTNGGKTRRTGDKKTAAVRPLPPAQDLRGNLPEVVRDEVVLSARRVVGIKGSFDQDGFIRHILVVNNLGLGKLPSKGAVSWFYQQAAADGRAVNQVQPGDILFLGDDEPEMCVVAVRVDDDDTVAFIGVVGDTVQEGVLSLARQDVRRDEKTNKVLNSFVGKAKLAGSQLLGSYAFPEDDRLKVSKH